MVMELPNYFLKLHQTAPTGVGIWVSDAVTNSAYRGRHIGDRGYRFLSC
jgi:hypothetical protein